MTTPNNTKIATKYKKTYTSRAELLGFLSHGEEYLQKMAKFAGYVYINKPKKPEVLEKPRACKTKQINQKTEQKAPEYVFTEPEEKVKFWYSAEYRSIDQQQITDKEPAWARGETFAEGETCGNYNENLSTIPPLVPWSKLWPFLKNALANSHERSIDIERLIQLVAKLKPLQKLPKKTKQSWAPICNMVLDFSERLVPFWSDMDTVYQGIKKLRGNSGFEVYHIEQDPNAKWRKHGKPYETTVHFVFPEPNTPIFIISDLGCLETSDTIVKAWLRFGKRLKTKGLRPIVLTPCPPRLWNPQLLTYFYLTWWERGQRLSHNPRKTTKAHSAINFDYTSSTERLLSILSPAIRVEPGLLRAVRLLLPKNKFDSGVEAAAWNHQSVHSCPIAFTYETSSIEQYRKTFTKEENSLRNEVFSLIQKYHSHLPTVKHEEQLIYNDLTNKTTNNAQNFIAKFFRTIYSEDPNKKQWFERVAQRQHQQMWTNKVLMACWFKINYTAWKKGEIELKQGMDLANVAWMIPKKNSAQYTLTQIGNKFVLSKENTQKKSPFTTGSPIATLTTNRSYLQVFHHIDQNTILAHATNLDLLPSWEMPVPTQGTLLFRTDCQEITIKSTEILPWMSNISRNHQGLSTIIKQDPIPEKVTWFNPGIAINKGFWGHTSGKDEYGYYVDLTIKAVPFRMRWIQPGTFMMGSPQNEPERGDNEVLHKVILTEGFWLAETACTQELWEAVMGSNPSHFKGKQKPVENISWNDCNEFITKINHIANFHFRFPTEAEWEYVCRAGTQTPFSFGNNITTEQVNYDGNHPYSDGLKGIFRRETVDVKSLPCNNWGLYQMHGNVFEWCYDWYGDYNTKNTTNPIGTSGEYKVVRGGYWFNDAGSTRSAFRDWVDPDFGNFNVGFRFARGHQASGAEGK